MNGVLADEAVDRTITAEQLREQWMARWPEALALWSPYLRLREPTFCATEVDEQREGISGSFAMIRLVDQAIVISTRTLPSALHRFPLEILGHEIGHHVLCPADLTDNARLIARTRPSLALVEHLAPLVANMYADLLINDRLQRTRGLDMAGVFMALPPSADRFWTFYMRTYEMLWSLPSGTLTAVEPDERQKLDAVLAARIVRSLSSRWLDGAGPFAAICFPYFLNEEIENRLADKRMPDIAGPWLDAIKAGHGGFPDGLTEIDPEAERPSVHPAFDPTLSGQPLDRDLSDDADKVTPGSATSAAGQYREPFEYGDILRATGLDLDPLQLAVRYYRERASRHLIPFPTKPAPHTTDVIPEGVEPWDVGQPVADIDWFETMIRGTTIVPGHTTVQRIWGEDTGEVPRPVPIDLDIYVDSSGSMPNPQVSTSYLTLAGAIVALSALRAGASVQVTLWSGSQQFTKTDGFVRDERSILGVLVGYFGGATAFPIHVLRDTYESRPANARPAHVLVISDDGVNTMFDKDEHGKDGRKVTTEALRRAGGGGTMVLNLWCEPEKVKGLPEAITDGWDIHVVSGWEELVEFGRAFSRRHYVHGVHPELRRG